MTSMEPTSPKWTSGWLTFAAIVLYAVGFLRIISGISYLADSHRINNYTLGLFGDHMWVWGIWDLGIAALAIYAAYSLLEGGEFGRIVAYIWAILVIVNAFLVLAYSPWYGAASMTLAGLVVYGLATTTARPRDAY
jgi:hypothetical protein